MHLFTLALVIYIIYRLVQSRKQKKIDSNHKSGYIDFYETRMTPNHAFERLLGHPFATSQILYRYYSSDPEHGDFTGDESFHTRWEPALLAYLNLKPEKDKTVLADNVTQRFEKSWYKLGLSQVQPNDDLTAAMAFATAKLSFALQCALMLNWINRETHAKIMQKNAIRAIDCFSSWQEYGRAISRGRLQYIANGFSDYIGNRVTEEMVQTWLSEKRHPWNTVLWPKRD